MKEKTVDQKLSELCSCVIREINVWKTINENGCNDPFWPDGCNMNLTRNHIISYKSDIAQICDENNIRLPEEYFLPTPPEVDKNYMAKLNQKNRVKRIRQMEKKITTKKNSYDVSQMSLF